MKLILASTSPYRRELLSRLRVPFECLAPGVNEDTLPGESPSEESLRLATEKALAISRLHKTALVIGSDQTASLDGQGTLGKPGSHERAREQLRAASGRSVWFHTSLSVVRAEPAFSDRTTVSTQVRFRVLDDDEIEHYLRVEQPYDCAGSAKCEGLGISLLEAIEGEDPSAIIGLPLIALCRMLRRAGVSVPAQSLC